MSLQNNNEQYYLYPSYKATIFTDQKRFYSNNYSDNWTHRVDLQKYRTSSGEIEIEISGVKQILSVIRTTDRNSDLYIT